MSEDIDKLIAAMKESEQQAKDDAVQVRIEMAEIRQSMLMTNESVKEMADTLSTFLQQQAKWEEERKHDAEFKKEVRTFIKDSTPTIIKAKDFQEKVGKWVIMIGGFFLAGILGFFYNFK